MRRPAGIATVALLACVLAALPQRAGLACTAFCAIATDGRVLVGNNEDFDNPRTRIRFVPATAGAYGRMYVGFDDLWPQGGMNERGLWFDGFATPPVRATSSADLPAYPGNIVDAAMAQCATVDDVVRLFSRYNRAFLTEAVLMFADASGDAVSIEPNAIVRKSGGHFVQTNFHQSRGVIDGGDKRFDIASAMLRRAGTDISVDLFRRILAATHQEGGYPTLYSNVYDLRSRTMQLYYFHDFDRAVTVTLAEELAKGEHVIAIPSLFPRHAAAEAFAALRPVAAPRGPAPMVAALALGAIAVVAAAITAVCVGRRGRLRLVAVLVSLLVLVASTGFVLHGHGPVAPEWIEFSLAPASGDSLNLNETTIRGDGATLKGLIAIAHDIPAARVIAPAWLAETRYAIRAVVGLENGKALHSLLREELDRHLQLRTHREVRPFDVLVLRATATPRLQTASVEGPSIIIGKHDAQARGASLRDIAAAVHNITGRPVLDETGLTGAYDVDLAWGDDRTSSLTAVLRDRFGLQLTPARRDMEALVVDAARRDPGLLLLAQAGRLTRVAPASIRQTFDRVFTIE